MADDSIQDRSRESSTELDEEINSRTLIIGNITEDLSLEELINELRGEENSTHYKQIESFDIYDYDKIRLTYSTVEEAEKLLEEKGNYWKLNKLSLTLIRATEYPTKAMSSIISPSALCDNTFNQNGHYYKSHQDSPQQLIDEKRVLITNIPKQVTYEHLLLYLEYLSDEIGIEHVDDASKDVSNSIVVKFNVAIDFNKMKEKHSKRPSFLNHETELLQIYEPTKLYAVYEGGNHQFSIEFLELYFQNKKRSGGENLHHVDYNKERTQAVVCFKSGDVAQHVASLNHTIDKKRIKVRLMYEITKQEPLSNDLPNQSIPSSYSDKTESEAHRFKPPPSRNNEMENLQNSFDATQLNEQQTKYLLGLQSIYNELNFTDLNLFKTNTNQSSNYKKSLEEDMIFSHYFTDNIQKNNSSIDALLALPKPTAIKDWSTAEQSTDTNQTGYKGTLSHAEADAEYANSIIDHSFRECFDNISSLSEVDTTIRRLSIDLPKELMTLIKDTKNSEQPSETNDSENFTETKDSEQGGTEQKAVENNSGKKSKKNFIPPRFVRRHQLCKKNKDQAPMVIPKLKKDKPPPPKILKLKHEDDKDGLLNTDATETSVKTDSKRSQSALEATSYNEKYRKPLDTVSLKAKDQDLDRTSNTSSAEEIGVEIDLKKDKAGEFELKRENMAPNSDLTKAGKKNKNHFKVDLAKKNFQSLYGQHTLSSSIDKLNPNQINFFRNTKYLGVLATIYPKVKFNLNENLRNIYLFGTTAQVQEAKIQITRDIALITESKFPLQNKEMASFLKKSQVKQKILKFIETIINGQGYQKGKNSIKPRDLSKDECLVKYCTYEINSEGKMELNKEMEKKIEDFSHSLIVYSNLDYAAEMVNKFIVDSISVGRLHVIKSKEIVDYIKSSKPEWTQFYENRFKNSIDFNLKEKIMISKSYTRSKRSSTTDKSWQLKITGFKEEVEEFVVQFEAHFVNVLRKNEKHAKR